MKPDPKDTEKKITEDLRTFEELPEKTKELQVLTEHAEKAIGQENADLHQEIREKSESRVRSSAQGEHRALEDKRSGRSPVVMP